MKHGLHKAIDLCFFLAMSGLLFVLGAVIVAAMVQAGAPWWVWLIVCFIGAPSVSMVFLIIFEVATD